MAQPHISLQIYRLNPYMGGALLARTVHKDKAMSMPAECVNAADTARH